MNWKRGLVRLWAVASVLWLLIAVPVAMFMFATSERRTIDVTAEEFLDGAERVEYVWVWNAPPWYAVAFVLGAPVVLLGLGSAGFWVANGFRAKS